MKKVITAVLILFTVIVSGQNMQVQNMANYLRNKDYPKAKQAADAAAQHESTKNSAKTWLFRGDVYKAIADTSARDQIDPEAEEKALEAYTNCFILDKGKDVYKEDKEAEQNANLKGKIVKTAAAVKRKALYYSDKKEYEKALHCYDLMEQALPFDFAEGMKRQNITKEKILFSKFEMYKVAANKEKTKEYANKLMDIKYKDPQVYLDMVRLSLLDKDTTAALAYIERGKQLFDDNMGLIGTEIDIYIARKKTAELLDKVNKAIELSPDNELLYVVAGQVYERNNDMANAERSYLKAVEIKPDHELANYKLGNIYFTIGADYNNKLADLPPKQPAKEKEYEGKVQENYKKAAPYLEKAYEVTPDKAYKQRLLKIYSRLGETEKAAKYK
jgi:tetratricopeptide (TPR) repeat protein